MTLAVALPIICSMIGVVCQVIRTVHTLSKKP